jgi:hypothetical protein
MDKHVVLSLFHLAIIAPLFLFIGFQRASVPHWLYTAILTIGIIIFLYHGFKLFFRIRANSSHAWINAIHVFLVAPLLIYIGYHNKETPRAAYEVLLMAGFAAVGYHLFSLVKWVGTLPEDAPTEQ